jgi:Regulator of chromosome condensation (RCC1) repeat
VRCWGDNSNGQLGDGTTTDRSTPVSVSSLGGTAVAIVAGWEHTCAVLSGGSVRCWGRNYNGQLGDGSTTDCSTPASVSSLVSVLISCSPGSTRSNPTEACSQCAPGAFVYGGSTKCCPCSGGKYSDTAGSSVCKDCSAGKYSRPGASSVSACLVCPSGTSLSSASFSCEICPLYAWSVNGLPCSPLHPAIIAALLSLTGIVWVAIDGFREGRSFYSSSRHMFVIVMASGDFVSDVFFASSGYAFSSTALQAASVTFLFTPVFGYLFWMYDQSLFRLLDISDPATSYVPFVPVLLSFAQHVHVFMVSSSIAVYNYLTTWASTHLNVRQDKSAFYRFFQADMTELENALLALLVAVVLLPVMALGWLLISLLAFLLLALSDAIVLLVVWTAAYGSFVLTNVLYHFLGFLATVTKVLLAPSFVRWWVRGLNPKHDVENMQTNRCANVLTLSEITLESLPQMVIVVVNNAQRSGGWSPVSIVAFSFSTLFLFSQVWRYTTKALCKGIPLLEIPLVEDASKVPESKVVRPSASNSTAPARHAFSAVPQGVIDSKHESRIEVA